MKKFFAILSILFLCVVAACDNDQHTHNPSSEWLSDSANHWHLCLGCEELIEKAEHIYGEWTVTIKPTVSTVGTEKRVCTICAYEEFREVPKLSEHTHSFSTEYSANSTHHWYACECGEKKDSAEHQGGTATSEELAICDVCGKEYGSYADHECTFVDGLCQCGKTEPGAFDKTIDASLDDWSSEEQADALVTFGESGTGFGVNGYHKDGKAYFVTKIVTATVNPHSFQIFQRDGQTRYILRYGGEGNWYATDGADYCIAVSGQYKTENGLNVFIIESVWDFSNFPKEANGNYKINFSVVLPKPELSAASYSDVQQDYWVLYGRNAWSGAWSFVLTDTTKFEHSHVFSKEYKCVVCGASNELEDSVVTFDGKIDDWDSKIVDTMLVSYDEEERWIKQVGFVDKNYLYLYVSIAHRDAIGTLNVVILGGTWYEYGKIIYGDAITLKNIKSVGVNEYKDETGSFTVTDYEFAISLAELSEVAANAISSDGVRLGIDITNTAGEESYEFAIDNKTKMWGIGGYSSWNVNQHFTYGTNGVSHKHDWDDYGFGCKLCDEPARDISSSIIVDGDLSDWSENIIATSSKTYGESGTGWEIMGFRVGTIVYFGVTIKTAGKAPALFSFVERGSLGFTDHQVRYSKGEWKKCAGVLYLGSALNDTDTIDTYVLELVCDLSELKPLESGDYLFGLDVNVPGEASAASFSEAKPEYWVMFGRNAWESDAKMFTVTTSGITHKHILENEYLYNDNNHWKQCLCGYTEESNHTFESEYKYNIEEHWLECLCGYQAKETHAGGQATTTKLAICETCEQPYGYLEGHTHSYEIMYDDEYHWSECSCGLYKDKEIHSGGQATFTEKAICDGCGQEYGDILDYLIIADGSIDDWTEEQKSNSLKGWYEDSQGRIRGLEYMAFVDDKYVYVYTKTITESKAAKSLDVIFSKGSSDRLYASLSATKVGANILDYYFVQNKLLTNGLYETVSEIILDKSAYVNSNGNIYLGVWFNGCDEGFEPLSWHEKGTTTSWVLNHRSPWYANVSHQRVTENGFEHYHDLTASDSNVCGWCQETIDLSIDVDGDSSDWSDDILLTGITSTSPNNVFTTAFIDDEFVYIYLEITQLAAVESNYISIYSKYSANFNGIRSNERFNAVFDAGGTNLHPYCKNKKGCEYNYCDCDNGFAKMAMARKTNDSGQSITCFEFVIDKELFINQNPADAQYGKYRFEIQIGPNLTTNQNISSWKMMIATENGLAK